MPADIVIRSPDAIVREFNATVRGLVTRLEKKSRSDIEVANLDRLKKRITLLRQTMGEPALIVEASPFFVEYAESILDRPECEKLFMTVDVRAEYLKRKGKVEKQDEFIFSLVDSIRGHYTRSHAKERDDVYAEVRAMLDDCLEYGIAVSN